MPPDLQDRYLALLGLTRRPPGREALSELVEAHVRLVPFETVSKLLRFCRHGLTTLPSLQEFLDGIERHRFGGTCYACNCHLWSLLSALGYRARLCGADMDTPDLHVVVLVELEDRPYLLDAGYGAPFFDPLPLDLEGDLLIPWGHESHRLRPRDGGGRARLEVLRRGGVEPGYLVNPAARSPDHFRAVISGSYRPEAYFMNNVALHRYDRERSVSIRNLLLTEATPDSSRTLTLPGAGELAREVEARFGIAASLVAEALDGLPGLLASSRNPGSTGR